MVNAVSLRTATVAGPAGRPLLDQISFDIAPGEHVGLIGASGSGKSLTAALLCGLLRPPLAMRSGELILNGTNLTRAGPKTWRTVRGRQIFQIFQSPGSALTPGRRIGPQLAEATQIAGRCKDRVVEDALDRVALPQTVARQFPYQLSGGMKQRVLIAMALILRPAVLVADEPTTGLDVLTEGDILAALRDMIIETGAALLFISHDLRAVEEVADRVLVMHSGRLVEDASIDMLACSDVTATRNLVEAAHKLKTGC